MWVSGKKVLEDRAGRRHDHFVRLKLFSVLTSKSGISKVFVSPQSLKGILGIILKVVPLKRQSFSDIVDI